MVLKSFDRDLAQFRHFILVLPQRFPVEATATPTAIAIRTSLWAATEAVIAKEERC